MQELFCYCGDGDDERMLFLGRGTQKVISHRIEDTQAPGSQYRAFLLCFQDTDLQEDSQIIANIKLNPANNSSAIVLLN